MFWNGLIVEYNKLVTALLGCNSNLGLLRSDGQSKNLVCYLLKYVTKKNTGIAHSASLNLHARRVIEQFSSVAEDNETLIVNAMHLLNRVANKITCAVAVVSIVSYGCISFTRTSGRIRILPLSKSVCSTSSNLFNKPSGFCWLRCRTWWVSRFTRRRMEIQKYFSIQSASKKYSSGASCRSKNSIFVKWAVS